MLEIFRRKRGVGFYVIKKKITFLDKFNETVLVAPGDFILFHAFVSQTKGGDCGESWEE